MEPVLHYRCTSCWILKPTADYSKKQSSLPYSSHPRPRCYDCIVASDSASYDAYQSTWPPPRQMELVTYMVINPIYCRDEEDPNK